jgi:hypothetical protein
VPSVADLIFIVLLFALTCGALAPRLLRDASIGWHIRNGQQMLHTHAITRTDPFSSTMGGQPWYAWEWLYDVAIASIHDWLGLNGVVFFTALIVAATLALALSIALRRGGALPPTLILLVLSIGASTIHMFARPHVLSWLFAVIWFGLLESSETATGVDQRRRLFWLPVLMLVWVNVHGGFLIGFVLLGVYLAGGWAQYRSQQLGEHEIAGKRLKRLGAITALSLLASLANPYGYKLHVHIYEYLSNRFLMDHIDEFQSPNFHGVAQRCFAVLLLISIVALASARRKLRRSQLLVILFAAYGGLYASRNLPVSSILLTLTVAPLLSEAVAGAGANPTILPWLRGLFSRCELFVSRVGRMELSLRRHTWPLLAVGLGLFVCLQHGRVDSWQVMDAHFDERRLPVQATQVIARRDLRDALFCPDYWGGYLIYRLYPQAKVFVDDRHDLYGEQFLQDYLKVVHVEPDWQHVLEQKRVHWVLAPAGSSLANILKETPAWTIIYEDATAALFFGQPTIRNRQ